MKSQKNSLYDVLGVSTNATKTDIKKAYRQLASQYHPDKNDDPRAKDFFNLIKEAYTVLSSEEKRRAYDSPEYNNIINHIFGNGPVYDKVHVIYITLEEAYTGCIRPLGADTVEISAGVYNGARMSHDGLLYKINIVPHAIFKRNGADLLVNIEYTTLEALFDQEVTIHMLDGSTFEFMVSGAHTGQVLGFEGKGMPDQITGTYGDLFVHITVKPLKNSLTNATKDAIMSIYNDNIKLRKVINESRN